MSNRQTIRVRIAAINALLFLEHFLKEGIIHYVKALIVVYELTIHRLWIPLNQTWLTVSSHRYLLLAYIPHAFINHYLTFLYQLVLYVFLLFDMSDVYSDLFRYEHSLALDFMQCFFEAFLTATHRLFTAICFYLIQSGINSRFANIHSFRKLFVC